MRIEPEFCSKFLWTELALSRKRNQRKNLTRFYFPKVPLRPRNANAWLLRMADCLGIAGLRPLADAWHRRVMADEVVAHAFSHGFHPHHVEVSWTELTDGTSLGKPYIKPCARIALHDLIR
jgi:hypothetical protein